MRLQPWYEAEKRARTGRSLPHELFEEIVLAFENVGIVERGDKQNVLNLVAHHVEVDVLVEHLFVEELLQWLPVLDIRLAVVDSFARIDEPRGLVHYLTSLVVVDIAANKSSDIAKQSYFFPQERSVVGIGTFPSIENLDGSFPVVERNEIFPDEPGTFAESFALVGGILIGNACASEVGELKRLGNNVAYFLQGFL